MTTTEDRASEPTRGRARRTPSLADVAREAGVAPITASRVANGRGNVDAGTRTRVLETMSRVGYRPNLAARALATGTFKSIGLLSSGMRSTGNMWTISEVATRASERGFTVMLLPFELHGDTIVNAYDRLRSEGVDGAIVIAERRMDDARAIVLPPGVPVVFVDAGGGDDHTTIDSDQIGGARLATEHLLDLGHRTVHHIAGPDESFAASRRRESWQRTLEERGCRVPEPMVGDWSSASGAVFAERLRDEGATAVFAANDRMALGLLRRLRELGLELPEDMSVVGFDDEPYADLSWPRLTTVRQSFAQVGRIAVDTLLERIAGGEVAAPHQTVPVELVVRESAVRPAPERPPTVGTGGPRSR